MSWALVTGGSRRLGREFSLHLASLGWDVHLHFHNSEEDALVTAGEIKALRREVRIHQADLAHPKGVEELLSKIFGPLGNSQPPFTFPTLVINCASSWEQSTWDTLETEDAYREFQITSLAPFIIARECARRSPQGLVINLLDARMEDYDKFHLAYHLAKRSLATLTRILALETAPGWRVNALAPGLILKPDTMSQEDWNNLEKTNPLNRMGDPKDLLRTLDYYLDSPFVTGQVIFVDGGRFLKGGFYGF